MAEIPNWCQQRLPDTGLSIATTLTATALLFIVAGYCLLRGARRTITIGLVVAVGVGVLMNASPASAVSGITCPSGYEVFPQPAKMSIDFAGTRLTGNVDGFATSESTFTLNVDLNGGMVYQPFTVEVTGSAFATKSLNAGPRVVTGAGWTVAPKNGDKYSGALILTFSPTGTTSKLPPAEVRFGLETGALELGGKWTIAATATGIPANTASASAGYPFAIYDTAAVCGPDFVDFYEAEIIEAPVIKTGAKLVAGTPPFTYIADGLTGYTMAQDGTVTLVDAKPGTTVKFQLTVSDANGASFKVPGSIWYPKPGEWLPKLC